MFHSALSLSLLLLAATPVQAQRGRCGAPEPLPEMAAFAAPSDCGYLTNSPQPEYEPACFFDIQVVFHVIQNTQGQGFLSAAKIQEQIDVLNEDFQAIPGSLGAPGTNAQIRFHLATIDPVGNPTSGITYSTNNSWYQDSGNYWNSLAWDTNRYLNVYTNAVPCCYGYVPDFPSQGIVGQNLDRVVLWWEAVGRTGTAGWPQNRGRTATHEIGHYLGLYHTFCGGCGSTSACYSTGDLICDTNRQANETLGCPSSPNSCGSPDPFHNYMDYTDDPCLWEFTPEQVNRMRCTLVHWRPNLYQSCAPEVGSNYCVSVLNSSGAAATIQAIGQASIAANNLTLEANSSAASMFGLFFYGPNQVQLAFGDGFRCVGGSTFRLTPPMPSDAFGTAQRVLDFTQAPLGAGSGQVSPGSTVHFQYWFRDPTGPGGTGFNLSDGLSIVFQP